MLAAPSLKVGEILEMKVIGATTLCGDCEPRSGRGPSVASWLAALTLSQGQQNFLMAGDTLEGGSAKGRGGGRRDLWETNLGCHPPLRLQGCMQNIPPLDPPNIICPLTQSFALTYLTTLAPMQGPIPKYPYSANVKKSIGMVAGGTGIAPMLQASSSIMGGEVEGERNRHRPGSMFHSSS